MNKRALHYQADRIEMVLHNHRAPGRVTGGRVTPRAIQFHVTPGPTTKVSQLEKLSEEIALSLGVSSARVTRARGQIAIEVPRLNGQPITLLGLQAKIDQDPTCTRALASPGTGLLGMDSDGIPLLIRLASPDVAHILIVGTTGSGKTELTRTLIASLMLNQRARDLQMILIDPKGTAFKTFVGLPHLWGAPVSDIREVAERLRWLVGEMERRDVEGIARPRLVFVVDELADLLMSGDRQLQADLTRLVQRGRGAGISVIACTQKPSAAAVGSLVKANFPVRLVGRVTSSDEARLASGMAGSGAEHLLGRGDFILIAGGQRMHFQAAHIPAADWPAVRDQILRLSAAHTPTDQAESKGWLGRLLGSGR